MTLTQWQDRIERLRSIVPDPRSPVQPLRVRGETRRRWASQHQRRCSILSSARQLVAETGLDNVHMQSVASRSGVSVQTVYNVVGNRSEVLGTAASEWIVALADKGEIHGNTTDTNVTFATFELFWAAAIIERDYGTNLIQAQSQCGMLERPFLTTTHRVLTAQLRQLQAEGSLVRWANVSLLARHLATAGHACVRDWLAAPYDEGVFRDTLVNGCGLLLRGAFEGAEVGRLERALEGA